MYCFAGATVALGIKMYLNVKEWVTLKSKENNALIFKE